MSLSGPVRPLQENTSVRVNKALNLKIPGVAMTWTLVDQITGLDWPVEIAFKGGTLPPATRAEAGHHWLGIVAQVHVGTCACDGILDEQGTAQPVYGRPADRRGGRRDSNSIMNAQTVSDVLLVFSVPDDAPTATLQIGSLDKPEQQVKVRSTSIEAGGTAKFWLGRRRGECRAARRGDQRPRRRSSGRRV